MRDASRQLERCDRGPSRRPLAYKWVVLVNTTIGVLMASIDSSIVTIALPDITRTLRVSVAEMMWIVMGYSLVITSALLPIARLADMKIRVRLYSLGFAIFTAASALCGFSRSGLELVVFRLVQGAGAAFLFANGTALVTDAFPPSERGFALGVNLTVGVSGFLLGTVLGGVVTHFLGWRYIFFLNLPFGIFATMWTYTTLYEIVPPERTARFDIGGMVTFPLGMAAILAGLTEVVMGRASDVLPRALFVCGGAMLLAFFLIERRAPEPMMDLGLFRIRLFLAANLSLFLNALSRGATMFVMSWYFQAVRKDTPLAAGWKLMPWALAMMALSPIAGRLSDRFGSRGISTAGLIVVCGSQLRMTRIPINIRYGSLGLALAALGAGHGIFNSPNTSAVMGSVPANRRGVAAGTRTLLNNSGQTLAIALAMVVLSTVISYRVLTDLFAGTASVRRSLNGVDFMRGFHELFALSALITVAAIVCSSLRGREDRGRALLTAGDVEVEDAETGRGRRPAGGEYDLGRRTRARPDG